MHRIDYTVRGTAGSEQVIGLFMATSRHPAAEPALHISAIRFSTETPALRWQSATGKRQRERSFDVNDGRIDVPNAVTIKGGAMVPCRKRQRKLGASQAYGRRINELAEADLVNQGFNGLRCTFAVTALQLGNQ